MQGKFVRWLVCGILVGLIPTLVNFVIVLITPVSLSLSALVGRGELLMLSVGLAAGAIADVWHLRSARRPRKFALLLCLGLIFGTTIVFTVNAVAIAFEIPVFKEVVAVVSLIPYALSVLVSAGCIVAVERKDRTA